MNSCGVWSASPDGGRLGLVSRGKGCGRLASQPTPNQAHLLAAVGVIVNGHYGVKVTGFFSIYK